MKHHYPCFRGGDECTCDDADEHLDAQDAVDGSQLSAALALVRHYNRWRRGEDDESTEYPASPREIGNAIDTVCDAVDRLESLQQHLESIAEKLIEVREELADEGNDFRLVPLSYQDSGCVLAVCEKIGVDLIPLTPWQGSMFLGKEQLEQLNEAMAEFRPTND